MLHASLSLAHVMAAADQPTMPNFVVFIADDHGDGDLGCYGNTSIRTPCIDRLASEGIRFDAAFLTTSSCSPSRASILTGRYPHNTGAEDLHQPLPDDQRTVAAYLRAADYTCAAVGKWHLGDAEREQWETIVECNGADIEPRSLELLASLPATRPFFLWIASTDPHRPYQLKTIDQPHDPSVVTVPAYLPDHPSIRKELALYYDEITRFDHCVGAVCGRLEQMGYARNTVVVYLSDNGMPFPRAKTTLYDSGIRTPLIVRWPGQVAAGRTSDALISSIDLAPTLLALAGVQQTTMQGRSMKPLLLGDSDDGREAVFGEANWHDFDQFTRAVRTVDFKLIRNYYWQRPLWNSVDSINSITWQGLLECRQLNRLTGPQAFLFRQPRPYEELYDLRHDPLELNNLVDDPRYTDQLARLRTQLDNWRVDTNDVMPPQPRRDGWTRDGNPLPHNQPWYDRWLKQGKRNQFETY
jgi:arylsulfatase A-like enzyme